MHCGLALVPNMAGSMLLLLLHAAHCSRHDNTSRTVTVQCSNATDCTEPLQAALLDTSADHVIVPNIDNRAWNTRPLILNRSNVTLELQEGVILQARRHWFHIPPAPNSGGGIMLLKVDLNLNYNLSRKNLNLYQLIQSNY